MSLREGVVIAPLLILIVVMGVMPQPFFRPMKPAIDRLLGRYQVVQVGTVVAPLTKKD